MLRDFSFTVDPEDIFEEDGYLKVYAPKDITIIPKALGSHKPAEDRRPTLFLPMDSYCRDLWEQAKNEPGKRLRMHRVVKEYISRVSLVESKEKTDR